MKTDRRAIGLLLPDWVFVQHVGKPREDLRPADSMPNRETARWDNRNDNLQGETE